MNKGDKVVVVGPDRTTFIGKICEVGKTDKDGQMFSVGFMPNSGLDGYEVAFMLFFLGPPDARGWWEGGPTQCFRRRRFYCMLAPVGLE